MVGTDEEAGGSFDRGHPMTLRVVAFATGWGTISIPVVATGAVALPDQERHQGENANPEQPTAEFRSHSGGAYHQ